MVHQELTREIERLKTEADEPNMEVLKLRVECDKLRAEAFELNGQLVESLLEADRFRLELLNRPDPSIYPLVPSSHLFSLTS